MAGRPPRLLALVTATIILQGEYLVEFPRVNRASS